MTGSALAANQDIVDFAASCDYVFSITAWLKYVELDSAGLSESEAMAIQAIASLSLIHI